jgi:hypothetical protein
MDRFGATHKPAIAPSPPPRKDLPTGLSPDGADGEVRYVLKSIGNTCPAAVQPLTVGSEVYLTRNSS